MENILNKVHHLEGVASPSSRIAFSMSVRKDEGWVNPTNKLEF